jgi:DNA-nicking Smr family endonuclease
VKPPRGLSADEAAAWAQLAATVKPMAGAVHPQAPVPARISAPLGGGAGGGGSAADNRRTPPPSPPPRGGGLSLSPGLDSHWDRRFRAGGVAPDFTLDLHGHTLDSAHARLDSGLAQARAMGARVVLVIAGKPRGAEAADRAGSRGAIRAKLLDWLAAGPHGSAIAAIRNAHPRHGGAGALYLVLKRSR